MTRKIQMTYHVQMERADRMVYILSNPDLCDLTPAMEFVSVRDNVRYCITVDGVLLIKAIRQERLITAYVPTFDKVYAICMNEGIQIPAGLAYRIKRNKKHNLMQDRG